MAAKSVDKWQYGDFQTPVELARKVVSVLKRNHGIVPDVIIEPTCGKGAFIQACGEGFGNAQILGYEINPSYVEAARTELGAIRGMSKASIRQADFFQTDWQHILSSLHGYLLIIGNPPWVTSSELGLLESDNLPQKSNFQNRKGIDAITGAGNFDISEWMLLQTLQWLENRTGALAFLCKTTVARKIMRQIRRTSRNTFFGHIYPIDARLYFGAAVEACLFVLTQSSENTDCELYESLESTKPIQIIGERDGFVVTNVEQYGRLRHLRGQDPRYIWRTGIKHDCSDIMELERHGEDYRNGLGEIVRCEQKLLYPLLKSSDIGNGRTSDFRKLVIVTQKAVGENTSPLQGLAPKTWEYLNRHKNRFDRRKSSIYNNKPDFSIFGVGPYSFRPWKVAISGLYKKLNFCIVGPLSGKPVMLDDTVNFLSFETEQEARFVYELLGSKPTLDFLDSVIFWDEKRPVTTEILRRLSLREVARQLGRLDQYRRWTETIATDCKGQLELAIAEEAEEYAIRTCGQGKTLASRLPHLPPPIPHE